MKHETHGRIRFHNPALHRKRELCQAIERELMSVPGVDRYTTNDLTDTVLIHYNDRHTHKRQLIEILDDVLQKNEQAGKSAVDLDLPICTASLGLAAAGTFFAPSSCRWQRASSSTQPFPASRAPIRYF